VTEPTTPHRPTPPPLPRSIAPRRRARSPPKPSYRPPRWLTPDTDSPAFRTLRAKALELKPLAGATEDQLGNLLLLFAGERKRIAAEHRYREGEKYNGVVVHVDACFADARKRNRQQAEQATLKAAEDDCRADTDGFDRETKRLERELREHQRTQRESLVAAHARELDELEEHWRSPAKFRLYNRPSNRIITLRRQHALLLVQCRFRDAEEVHRMIDDETRNEEAESHRGMQVDYDAALKMVLARQEEEVAVFDDRAGVQVQKFLQDRAIERRVYENRGKKIAAKEEIAADAEKLWIHEQGKRSQAIVGNIGRPLMPSAKLARKDIKDADVAILNLPPLSSRRKNPKKEKRAKRDDGDA
jgi:hypothetical protein